MKLCSLVVIYFLAICVFANDTLEYSAYCKNLCTWGRGGNVCRCSAVHFTGKRATEERPGADLSHAGFSPAVNGVDPSHVPAGQSKETTPINGLMLLLVLRKSQNMELHNSGTRVSVVSGLGFQGRDLFKAFKQWREMSSSSVAVQNLRWALFRFTFNLLSSLEMNLYMVYS